MARKPSNPPVVCQYFSWRLFERDGVFYADGRTGKYNRIRTLGVYELDARLPEGVDEGELVALMARDKKATKGLTFVLDGPAGIELVPDVPREAVERAFARMPR